MSQERENGSLMAKASCQVLTPVHEQHEPIHHHRYRKLFLVGMAAFFLGPLASFSIISALDQLD